MLTWEMTEENNKTVEKKMEFPHLNSVTRIARIPFVDSGLTVAFDLYSMIKTSNPVFSWGLSRAELSIVSVLDRTKPAVLMFNGPIALLDSLVCKSLDLVEEKVPVVTLPPELIYVSTKDYVSNTLVRPVLKRADSMKQFGLHQANTVLASKYTNMAAHRLDTALDIADKYVDQYLPADTTDTPQVEDNWTEDHSKAATAIHHVDLFSRKLQRRLTRRTIAEAKALKRQSVDAVQFMINMAELFAKDPKAAMEKAAILWAHLSEDEPENQARPQNLEQLTVMVSREVARRVVHLVNYARVNFKMSAHKAVTVFTIMADTIVKKTHLEGVKGLALTQTKIQASKLQALIDHFNQFTIQILEMVAANIAGRQKKQQSNGSAKDCSTNNHNARVLHNSFE